MQELYKILEWTIISFKPGVPRMSTRVISIPVLWIATKPVSDDSLQALRTLIPDSLILAALDLIDRGKGKLFVSRSIIHRSKDSGALQLSDIPHPGIESSTKL